MNEADRETKIANDVREFILSRFLPGESAEYLASDAPLLAGGILDSVRTLTLTSFLEETYGIEIRPADLKEANIGSIEAIARFVRARLSSSDSASP